MPNRLAQALSPYLRQHADNPVDWWPWGPEALKEAQAEDKPLFISIGYSACHWCHVMAHESFEDAQVAEALSETFLSVKVDREEFPDIDEAYMLAVQLATSRGGWPMTIFALPNGDPFFAGTYFPKEDRGGYPGFLTLVRSVTHAWKTQRQEIEKSAAEFRTALTKNLTRDAPPWNAVSRDALVDAVVESLHETFDQENGGFGNAPKFPPHTAISFLLTAAQSEFGEQAWRDQAAEMSLITLQKMALGGIHDHVGGGFHRYSTDAHWRLSHFEKMLTDQAQLLLNYRSAIGLLQNPPDTLLRHGMDWRAQFPAMEDTFQRACQGIVRFLAEEMTLENGTFATAIDADSDGAEGAFYTWSLRELEVLLKADSDKFAKAFGCTEGGNYFDEATHEKTGRNVLFLSDNAGDTYDEDLFELKLDRHLRPRPMQDDKAIAAGNGMMIRALVAADEVDAAERCARAWMHMDPLPHMIVAGAAYGEAYLDDVAHMALGCYFLAQARFGHEREEFMRFANALADRILAEFATPSGAFRLTNDRAMNLFGSSIPALDGSAPSANSAAIEALLLTGKKVQAESACRALLGWTHTAPNSTESLSENWLKLGLLEPSGNAHIPA